MTSTNHQSDAVPAKTVPIDRSPAAIEAWFAAAGVTATVVTRCPEPSCSICRSALAPAA